MPKKLLKGIVVSDKPNKNNYSFGWEKISTPNAKKSY